MQSSHTHTTIPIPYLLVLLFCTFLVGCNVSIPTNGTSSTNSTTSNTTIGTGVQGVQVFVEPDAGDHIIVGAIASAKKSVWLEMYLLSDRSIISALEEAAHRGLDVRVMLEIHPYGGGTAPTRTLDQLKAAGVQAQATSPNFTLTHEKGMIIDGNSAFIMTSNFTRSALGGTSGANSTTNREYGIIDTNTQDVQAVITIFNADWAHTDVQFNDPNLVVSPVNSRNDFTALINSAHSTLLIEAEEMQDNDIEQAIANAGKRGVHVQVILPFATQASTDTNGPGIRAIQQGSVQVKEDPKLYMHAKIIIVDGKAAFVGSENISTASLNDNRELGIIVADSNVLNTLQQTFQQDWGISQGV